MAVPTVVITEISPPVQDVSGGQDATVSPPIGWTVKGTVQHENGKQITAMWYQVDAQFPGQIPVPTLAAQPGTVDPVQWFFPLGMGISSNGDFYLRVYALNADGAGVKALLIHATGLPGGGGGPPPPSPPPPPPIQPVI